jgi:hypothetical protein
MARFSTLKERYEHHIEEEEDDVFPIAREVIGVDESGDIGGDFTRHKKEERGLVDEKAENALED